MHLRQPLYILIFIFLLCQNVSLAQVSEHTIIWLNADQKKMAGTLRIYFDADPAQSEFSLDFVMEWLDEKGTPIADTTKQPLLYLSESDILIPNSTEIFCKTFTDSDQFDISFSTNGQLVFGYLPDLDESLEIRFQWKYAFSEEDIYSARTYLVDYPSGKELVIRVPRSALVIQNEQETVDNLRKVDPRVIEICKNIDSCLTDLQSQSLLLINEINQADFQQLITGLDSLISSDTGMDSVQVSGIRDSLSAHLGTSKEYLDRIDGIANELTSVEGQLIPPVPGDSVLQYQTNIERINRRAGMVKSDILQYRIQMRSLLSNLGVSVVPNDLEEQRESITDRFLPVFNAQFDSVRNILDTHEVLMMDLEPILSGAPAKAMGSVQFDSLVVYHTFLRTQLNRSRNSHRQAYLDYVSRIKETGPIAELENIHSGYDEVHNTAVRQFDIAETRINAFRIRMEELSGRQDYSLLWMGVFALAVIIIFFLIRENRNRRIALIEKSARGNASSRTDNSVDIEEMVTPGEGYYPFPVPGGMESVVKEVHFSFRAIKSMNQIIHGAISQNQAESVGGFFLGQYYKTNGEGTGTYLVLIDQVISSNTLRNDFEPGISSNEDFVDEMDRVISQHKKQALLGWFTANTSTDFDMPDRLVKMHKTFFREKWQSALMVNPFSPDLEAALFVKRKSGFFESIANPGCRMNLEELYQYSLHPPAKPVTGENPAIDPNDYKQLKINSSWCDSLVQSVHFHTDVLKNIRDELDSSKMQLTSQQATGYFYGQVKAIQASKNQEEYVLHITRYVAVTNGDTPRELPGIQLLGWVGVSNREIFDSLKTAIPYHVNVYKKPYQIAVIVNSATLELRVFSQKHTFEMNNSIIETEEFNLLEMLS